MRELALTGHGNGVARSRASEGTVGEVQLWRQVGVLRQGPQLSLHPSSELLFFCQVDGILRKAMLAPGLAAMSALVVHNDTVLWTGNFGKKNGSDPNSGTPNEYTIYRLVG